MEKLRECDGMGEGEGGMKKMTKGIMGRELTINHKETDYLIELRGQYRNKFH